MSYSSTCSAWNTRWAHRKRQPGKWPSRESSSIRCQHDLTFAVRWGKTYIYFVWAYPALVLCYVSKLTKKSRFKTSSRNYWNFFFHSSFELVHMWIQTCHGTDLHFRACLGGLYYVYHKNLRIKLRYPCLAASAVIHWAMGRDF